MMNAKNQAAGESRDFANPEAQSEQVLGCLRRIGHIMDVRSRFLMANHGLSAPQAMVLRELARGGEALSICDLTRRVHLSQATLTGIVDRLQKQGLLRRLRSGVDRRRTVLVLTEEAAQRLGRMPTLLHEHFLDRFSSLSGGERNSLVKALQRVLEMMETATQAVDRELNDAE